MERTTDTENAGSWVVGQALQSERTVYATTEVRNGIAGWLLQHEIGHIVDEQWQSAVNSHKYHQGSPWASLGTFPYAILEDAFYDEVAAAADNAGIYAYAFTYYKEYFAEVFATSMAAQRYADTGLNYSVFTSGKQGICGTGDPDNLWPGIEAKMKSFGLITYSGNVT
jgi:hypothetical protein